MRMRERERGRDRDARRRETCSNEDILPAIRSGVGGGNYAAAHSSMAPAGAFSASGECSQRKFRRYTTMGQMYWTARTQ